VYTPQPIDQKVEHVIVTDGSGVDLAAAIKDLGVRGYLDVMVEGGSRLAAALVAGGHVDRIVYYVAAKLGMGQGKGAFEGVFATLADAADLRFISYEQIGSDLRIEAVID
jgi:diaminohydroxyphosphoribosylaminopyrimidine deaminase/5-amino-6-(5-phosphoribosylamino)uracil reductase